MAKTVRKVLATLGLIAVGLPGIRSAVFAAEPAFPVKTITLMVLVDDQAGVPAKILERARGRATRIFRQIDVDIVWLEHDDARIQDTAVLRSVVTLHLVARDMVDHMKVADDVMGRAAPGSRFVTVLYNRIEGLRNIRPDLTRGDAETACVLGHVIAHEIGHLLLPPHAHTLSGVMQADLDIHNAVQGGLFFSANQGHRIRTKLSVP
jgi:hypothetical protein